ncbi:MAG: hypothetical protein JWO67_3840 [Streptosporangiaceae bacterium]|nr:hypothetical protein [Streptosporangiaceae bacterium]
MTAMSKKRAAARAPSVDIAKIQQMAGLLAEVQDAYTRQIAEDKARYLADLEYVRRVREQVKAFEDEMLRDYWRTPAPLRATPAEVTAAGDISRAWLYQIRGKVERAGELGPDTIGDA